MLKKWFQARKPEAKASTKTPSLEETKPKKRGRESNRRHCSSKRRQQVKRTQAWDVGQFQVPEVPGKTRFHDLPLATALMRGISELGFQYCSPIQAHSLPNTLNGHDMLGKAQTGTGKTAAFLVAIINDLLNNPIESGRFIGEARALIVAPTRELALQIASDAEALAKYTTLKVHALVGGMHYNKQQQAIRQSHIDILVATPGRLLDFASSQEVFLDQVEILVLDEADRMLDMGFIPQVRRIVRMTPRKENRQTLFFSATFSPEVLDLAKQWTFEPCMVEIAPENIATETVEQHVYLTSADEKLTVLKNLLMSADVESMIVFVNRRDQSRRLYEKLEKHGTQVGLLSGDVPQAKRTKTLAQFKRGSLKVMVATDVAGRGIHIDGISHVVNYTLPEEAADYVHRIGRTGRAGQKGVSISFASEDDAFMLPAIEELLGRKLVCEPPPEVLLSPTVVR